LVGSIPAVCPLLGDVLPEDARREGGSLEAETRAGVVPEAVRPGAAHREDARRLGVPHRAETRVGADPLAGGLRDVLRQAAPVSGGCRSRGAMAGLPEPRAVLMGPPDGSRLALGAARRLKGATGAVVRHQPDETDVVVHHQPDEMGVRRDCHHAPAHQRGGPRHRGRKNHRRRRHVWQGQGRVVRRGE
jgi:hypothetical protein